MDIPEKEDGIDKTKKGECTMCKFVLIFALVVLLLVLVFTFFFRVNPSTDQNPSVTNEPFHSLPATPADFASTSLEYNQRVMELGQTARNIQFNTTTSAPSSAGVAPAPAQPTVVPDGPPPVMTP
jgi:flagellar basal body-associated protein FliL